jgi:EAL domain-containing protein (putative c-di-GMP-specific phosphodiesterase class I)
VQNIIKMADDLGIDVVAEGVETDDQRERLRTLDCGFMQGFSFCRPLEPDRIGQLLRSRFSTP